MNNSTTNERGCHSFPTSEIPQENESTELNSNPNENGCPFSTSETILKNDHSLFDHQQQYGDSEQQQSYKVKVQ
ncbi:hypothetical protein SK128_023454, partial [Halocaridina rubra]